MTNNILDLYCAMHAYSESSYIQVSEGEKYSGPALKRSPVSFDDPTYFVPIDYHTPEEIVGKKELLELLSDEARQLLSTIISMTTLEGSLKWRHISDLLRKKGVNRKKRLTLRKEIKDFLSNIVKN